MEKNTVRRCNSLIENTSEILVHLLNFSSRFGACCLLKLVKIFGLVLFVSLFGDETGE